MAVNLFRSPRLRASAVQKIPPFSLRFLCFFAATNFHPRDSWRSWRLGGFCSASVSTCVHLWLSCFRNGGGHFSRRFSALGFAGPVKPVFKNFASCIRE